LVDEHHLLLLLGSEELLLFFLALMGKQILFNFTDGFMGL
jgi:hypothetical protein